MSLYEWYQKREQAFIERFEVIPVAEAKAIIDNGGEVWSAHYGEESIDDNENDFHYTTITADDIDGWDEEEFVAIGPFAKYE